MPVTEAPGGLGHAFTPEDYAQFVLDHLAAQSVVLASGATRIVTAMRVVHVPRITSEGTADWYSELEEITAGDPQGDELQLQPRKVAAITKLSDESVTDSSPDVLDAVGTAMTRAVALKADSAILTGAGGKAPLGVYGQAGGHVISAAVTIDSLIDAAGEVAAVGGAARCAYVKPVDHTAMMKEKDGNQRPLLTPDYSAGPSSTVYGLVVWSTPAIAAGTALVADPTQIVCAIRSDPTVAVSTDAAFTEDGSVARVIARLDCGVNDPRGLVSIAATTGETQEAESDRPKRR